MSVYYKEKTEYLQQSMESILHQTIPASDFVLVCDGPLTPELDSVIEKMQQQFGTVLHVHRLKENGGLGKALNAGLEQCTCELVARMDSDDVSRPDRCEKQLQIFAEHPEYSLVSGIVEEFDGNIHHVTGRRVVPETQEKIIQFAKKRNPFNHPCIMYKKSAVQAVGSYQDFYLLEDYYLWIRMLQHGYLGYNIQKPLLWMRAGSDMYKRRGGWTYFLSQRKLLYYMHQSKFISYSQYLMGTFIRLGVAMAPNHFRSFIFNNILRRKMNKSSTGGGVTRYNLLNRLNPMWTWGVVCD